MTDLVDYATYVWVTDDEITPSANVEHALSDAQQLVTEECKRTFVYGTYTETLDVWRNGVVYPSATPVASVSDPASGTLRLGGIYLGPTGPLADAFGSLPAQRTVTYAGGYHPYGSGETPEIPIRLMRVICRIAYLMVHPSSMVGAGVPAGVKAASVGDVNVSGDLSAFVVADPSIERDLKRFVRRKPAQLTRSW